MIELDASLPSELVPLSWLLGVWEGTGVISYPVDGDVREFEFGQRMSFSHDGTSYLNYSSSVWLLDEGEQPSVLTAETGYWRLSRPLGQGDVGPGMLPGVGDKPYSTASEVETLRNGAGAFEIEVSIIHPGGVSELYLGQVNGPRIDLATDAVMRSADAKEHSASTRIYGLVEDHLLWAWDIAALGQQLTSHASARLARVD
ncbi:FABP family protein [Salinibacterium sp. dk2585]|uniref:FABP family protein n=1 Tax=unclassified Salinibacterium TaxID=2632331 RepID=UPI0011C24A31|nr:MULTISPECIES: FABP family protein [unclassified Salinibacterium]QEE62216.1 FABP family protein [Salinibacterium sp. dk2585]TXK53568.1 FABP family protein [Salinibacterium sp. dk5596]